MTDDEVLAVTDEDVELLTPSEEGYEPVREDVPFPLDDDQVFGMHSIQRGVVHEHDGVFQIQDALGAENSDGVFSKDTHRRVAAHQRNVGLAPTGRVDVHTWHSLLNT